ncbi:MAG: hypothetical protein AABY31_01730, partial [Thermoproteota archaeon]
AWSRSIDEFRLCNREDFLIAKQCTKCNKNVLIRKEEHICETCKKVLIRIEMPALLSKSKV